MYSVTETPVESGGRRCGISIELHDITDNYNYSLRLKHDVDDRTREIRHIHRRITAGIADMVEARDDQTGSHIKRMSGYVCHISKQLKSENKLPDTLTDDYITMLDEAAPLHDIGKLSVPDSILLKPAKLTADEFEIIKKHTTLGKNIIESIMRGVETDAYVAMAEDIAFCHHEKLNGAGYPSGLSGDAIPLSARITAVADVYGALRSERCYKSPVSKDEACKIIRECSGSHFDPDVAEAFLMVASASDFI